MRALSGFILIAAIAAWACDGDSPQSEPTSAASATAARPTSTPEASPTPRSAPLPEPTAEEIAFIERVIALVRAEDEAGLIEAARGGFAACESVHSGPGGGPVCAEGEPGGTQVEAIGESICDGALVRLEDAEFLIESSDAPLEVAAYRPNISGGDAGFFAVRFEGRYRVTLSVTASRIFNIGRGCSTESPLVFGRAVAQWVIPPPYQPFAAEGAFVRVVDEPGDADPFIWRFPMNRESGSGDYRAYAAEAFADEPSPGERICVEGWLDDVGNLMARKAIVNVAEPCELRLPESGIAIIDETIEAIYEQDFAALFNLVDYHTEGCIEMAQLSTPPQCEPGQPVGTPIEVITLVFCDGGPTPRREVERQFLTIFAEPFELHAVFRPTNKSDDGESYRMVLIRPRDGRAYWINLSENGIVSVWADCGAAESLGMYEGEYVIPPQFER